MAISWVYKRSDPHYCILTVCSGPQQIRYFAWIIALAEISTVSVVIVEPSMQPMKVLRHYYFAAVNTIGDAIFIPSLYDLGCPRESLGRHARNCAGQPLSR